MSHDRPTPLKDEIWAAWDVTYTVQLTQDVPIQVFQVAMSLL